MAVPKMRTSISKKRILKNIWKSKGRWAVLKAFSLANLFQRVIPKAFWGTNQINNERLE